MGLSFALRSFFLALQITAPFFNGATILLSVSHVVIIL